MPSSISVRSLVHTALVTALLVTASTLARSETAATPAHAAHRAPQSSGAQLTGERVTLPLVMVKGYPFVEGAINGTRGKLLFDIGDADIVSLDNHTVSAPGAIATGRGFFGSGQTYDVVNYPQIQELTLPGRLRFTDLRNIRGNPGLPLEQHITPDFIGWLGVRFFAGYVVRIDYAVPSVAFFRDDAGGSGERAALAGEHVLYSIPLSVHERYGLVDFPAMLGSQPLVGGLDTGSMNTLWLEHDQLASLVHSGALKPQQEGSGDDGHYTMQGLVIDGHPLPPMPVEVVPGTAPFTRSLTHHDHPVLQLGYKFLKQYKTVIDYDGGKLTLLSLSAKK